jgi:hypothetical protein
MASMPYEFTEGPPDAKTQPAQNRGSVPPGKVNSTGLFDPGEAIPPRGLVPRRWHISFWLAIALLLGAIVAYFLLGYAVE